MNVYIQKAANELNSFRPISLEEMSSVKLMNRTDTKYVISAQVLCRLISFAADFYRVQQTNGERFIEYNTTYYDTDDWTMLRAHTAGRLTRQKIRVRTYVSSNLTFIEIKNKNNHGRTKKKRVATVRMPSDALSSDAQAFVSLNANYLPSLLSPAVKNVFHRVTLVNDAMTERLTIDCNLILENCRNGIVQSLADTVVVEVKRDGRSFSPIVKWLADNHIRKCGFSKYCYGALLTDDCLPLGNMRPKMRRLLKKRLIPEPHGYAHRWNAA